MQEQKVLTDKNWIFLTYVPGSFGSFITKVIESSPDVYSRKNDNFTPVGSSHKGQNLWIKKFHNGMDIDIWEKLDFYKKQQYILKNITEYYYQTDLKKVHRFTVPKFHNLLIEIFPNAKFVKVVYGKKYEQTVIDMMSKKTYNGTLEKTIKFDNPDLYKILTNSSQEKQHIWYRKQCDKRIEQIKDFTVAKNTFMFDIENLFNGKHYEAFDKLFAFLDLKTGNYENLIGNFLELHRNI